MGRDAWGGVCGDVCVGSRVWGGVHGEVVCMGR